MEKIRCRDAKSRDCVVISELFKKMWDEVRPDIPLQDKSIDLLDFPRGETKSYYFICIFY